ncbi:MAG: DNA polymerase III subunit beta, partial [Pseudomonadota bacterium]|nr:DNA polymerase III subunit beta [Pseudomonadota bacterium]
PVMRAAATDGHRLARTEIDLPQGAETMPDVGIILPRKTVSELRKLIDEAEEVVGIQLSDAKICFRFGQIVLTSKLIDGTFPDYDRVIPKGNNKALDVDAREFEKAIDLVSTITIEKTRAVKLNISAASMVVSASSADSDMANEEIDARFTDAEPLEIGFNSRYLLDITHQIEGDTCQMMLADANSPALVKDIADDKAIYVIMPMRV